MRSAPSAATTSCRPCSGYSAALVCLSICGHGRGNRAPCAVLVCLTMCGHGSGNGTPCAGRAICASFDPLGVYIYAVGVESCATRLPLLRSVPLTDPNRGRAWHPREFGAVLGVSASHTSSDRLRRLGLRPRVIPRSLRRRSRRLRGDTRRNASSVDTPSCLATCLTAHPTNRVAACRSVRHSPPRPLPHLPIGALFFAASALADVPSARLTAPRHIRTPHSARSTSCDLAAQGSSRCSSGNLIAARQANLAAPPFGRRGICDFVRTVISFLRALIFSFAI